MVFLSGLEEGLFPTRTAAGGRRAGGERRLMYVAVTRCPPAALPQLHPEPHAPRPGALQPALALPRGDPRAAHQMADPPNPRRSCVRASPRYYNRGAGKPAAPSMPPPPPLRSRDLGGFAIGQAVKPRHALATASSSPPKAAAATPGAGQVCRRRRQMADAGGGQLTGVLTHRSGRRHQNKPETTMNNQQRFYIGGQWGEPATPAVREVINPATEAAARQCRDGLWRPTWSGATAAARAAFPPATTRESASTSSPASVQPISGATTTWPRPSAPRWRAAEGVGGQRPGRLRAVPLPHPPQALQDFVFEKPQGNTRILREPIGVCGLITPGTGRQPDGLQGGAGPRGGLHDGAQAQRAGAPVGHHPGRDPPRGRRAGGSSTWSTATAPGVGAPLTTHPDVGHAVLHRFSTRAGKQVMRAAAEGIRRSPWSSAASRPTSSSTTPTFSRAPSPRA